MYIEQLNEGYGINFKDLTRQFAYTETNSRKNLDLIRVLLGDFIQKQKCKLS